ncbi:MAG: N-acetylneuraminate synthase family protein [Terriglobales bacterium]
MLTGTQRPRFIAEVSSNHHRDLERAISFVDAAADIGCDGVKFQLFRVRELFAPEALQHNPKLLARKDWELPVNFLPPIASRCRSRGIDFSCTPFYLEAVKELLPYVDFYKIASYELLWDDLLSACAATGKPVVLSTGMATLDEVQRAVAVLRQGGCRSLTLLKCVSSYPAPAKECNLSAIETLRQATGCPVGWSDHSAEAGIIMRAVHRWGACMVEFHFDLEGRGDEFASGHCWLPRQIEPVIKAVRAGFSGDGDGKVVPSPAEFEERQWRADPGDGLRPLQPARARLRMQEEAG